MKIGQAIGRAGIAALLSGSALAEPQLLRDVNGRPVYLYDRESARTPPVRDGNGQPVADGSGGIVKSGAAAPLSGRPVTGGEPGRPVKEPSSSVGSSAPAPRRARVPEVPDPDSE